MSTSNHILSDMIDIIRIRIWIRPEIWKQIWYRWYPSVSDPFTSLLPTVIIALKGMADLKKEDKSPNAKEKKDNQVLILRLGRYVIPKEQL